MAKNIKIKLKNIQLGKTSGLEELKAKLAGEKEEEGKSKKEKPVKEKAPKAKAPPTQAPTEEEKPKRIRAKSRSSFAPKEEEVVEKEIEKEEEAIEQVEIAPLAVPPSAPEEIKEEAPPVIEEAKVEEVKEPEPPPLILKTPERIVSPLPQPIKRDETRVKLGPTGRHVKDLLPPKKPEPAPAPRTQQKPVRQESRSEAPSTTPAPVESEEKQKEKKVREFKDLKPQKKQMRPFDGRDRQGLGAEGDDERWRKKRSSKSPRQMYAEEVTRPTELKVRLPITIKDLADKMKLKSSELIQKFFLQGQIFTLNDILDDETTVQVLGAEFGCTITVDTTEEDRVQVTKASVQEEIKSTSLDALKTRPPVVAFMGHVDHGKTSLIDAIRKTNVASTEAGAITQHIGAFRCHTAVGDITILDTPGHEAFSSMRARGATVTDIIVLVVAGDEGIREQTLEAIQHAKQAKVTIVVAINKADKPNFNVENVYRQLSEIELLPEAWGGQTITVNTSAQTGVGIKELLEMLALQAEVLELRANPESRARGIVLESELHKGLGAKATILVQNGTLRKGDSFVLDYLWGRVKTMHDEFGNLLEEAPPSTPIEITGLSGVPKAGDSFVVVQNEKEAREIAEARAVGIKQKALAQKKAPALETFLQEEGKPVKKVLKLLLRADVQGSLEALKTSLQKIQSEKAEIDITFTGIGEITESDVELASASNAVIIGFHSQVESHATTLVKEMGVKVKLHDIIYHAVEDVRGLLKGLLDKIEEEKDTGTAEVKATFKASGVGVIAGCQVIEGTILRNNKVRVMRQGSMVWKGSIASLKRVKEDVREVKKGLECGILLEKFNELEVGDQLVGYEIVYHEQEL